MYRQYQTISTTAVAKAYWRTLRSYKWVMLLIAIFAMGGTAIDVAIPLFYKKFFDTLVQDIDSVLLAPELVNIIVMIFALQLGYWATFRIVTFVSNWFQPRVIAELRQDAYGYLIEHSHSFFADNFTGSLVQRVNRFARAFERLADRVTFNLLPLAVRLVGVIGVMWFIRPEISFILLGLTLAFFVFNYYFSRWKLPYNIQRAEAESRSTSVLADAITNQNSIQLFTGRNNESKLYKEVTNDQAKVSKFTWDLDAIADSVQMGLIILAEFLLLYFAVQYWKEGLITIGTFVLIQVYLIGLGGRLWDFSRILRDFYESGADAMEMVEILDLPHEVKDVPNAKVLEVNAGEIEFKKVEFSFHKTRQVLKKNDLVIKSGERMALIGPSGAGKSTLVKLLLRLYDVSAGKIFIDSQNIQHVTLESLRKNISLVPQDPILFHRTLMDNIRYGRPDATNDEVLDAARLAHCDEFILDLPDQYHTYVGERGVKLSGGERQRVAIARAILKNAPILVLDEATSSLDSHSESLIQDALDKLMTGKTTIVIAHRLSTIRKMDRIIVIDDGIIVEDGTHLKLSQKKGGLYQKLWRMQAGGFLPDSNK
jgi:ATP-binding cassette, subfamily B, bacterial